MKLLTKDPDVNQLHILKNLLEANGIPAVVHGDNTARMVTPFLMTEPSLWVYLDEQYADAEKLILDPNHEVKNKVDVEEFYDVASEVSENPRPLNNMLLNYGVGLVAILLAVIILTTWFGA